MLTHPEKMAEATPEKKFDFVDWHCPTCGPGEEKFLGYRSHLGTSTKIVQCRNCSLVYANPFPVARSLDALYANPAEYFGGHDSSMKVVANRAILRELQTRSGRADPRVIDIGGGCGELLMAANLEGIDAVGTEVSEAMIGFAKKHNQVQLLKKTIEDCASEWPNSFDGVVLNAVLEHSYDPDKMIASARKLLKSGGWIYIDAPNEPNILSAVAGGLSRLVGRNKAYNLSPTWEPFHVYGFNPRALQKLLTKHGFAIKEINVYCAEGLSPRPGFKNRVIVWVANRINDIGNFTGTSGNLSLWARLETTQ